ncbi:hypothetical protein FB563_4020 [Streptomyces puniciscabiei]|uniref:Uncharacterized protein n=1 Tax=Streptomyces puniciscabiei TaxID=164348 RepID=A0A542UIS3_9ACTN|nr:hypothetical protein [Streptomyces puniciscabiei]TQK98971.1 hypothetical protein FB563_4020 [Streptomyces puniciscabiei]
MRPPAEGRVDARRLNSRREEPLLRHAYEQGDARQWSDLLPSGQEPPLTLDPDSGLLEAATPETYLALRQDDLPYHRR